MTRPWRIWALAAAAVIAVAFGAACTSTGLDLIVRRGDVRVCSTGDYRPFTYRDAAGHWSGMDIEMAQDLATRLDVELNVVPTTWGTMMKDLGNRCDIAMGGISVTTDRAQHALYSIPYVRDGKAAMVRCADRSKYRTLAQIDRPGVRVVVNPDGTNADIDKTNIHHATIENYPDNNTIFGQVVNNTADVMITDASEIRWQTNENPQTVRGERRPSLHRRAEGLSASAE